MSDATRQAEILKPLIVGWHTPIFTELQGNRHVHALNREAFDEVMAGYCCGECLARFNTYQQICPVCGLDREQSSRFDPQPEGWQDYWNEHLYGGVTGRPNTAEDMLRRVAADKDIDQAKLSSLRANSVWRKVRRS